MNVYWDFVLVEDIIAIFSLLETRKLYRKKKFRWIALLA